MGRLEWGICRCLIRIAKMSLGKQTPSDFLKQIIRWPVVVKTEFWSGFSRGPGLPGWLHEHGLGADGRIRKWTTEE